MKLTQEEMALVRRLQADKSLRTSVRQMLAERRRDGRENEDHPFYAFQPQEYQVPVLADPHEIVGFSTANQVGKSTTGANWMAMRMMGFDPRNPSIRFPTGADLPDSGGARYWAATKGDLIDGLYDKVRYYLPDSEVLRERKAPGRQQIWMRNGNTCKFKSYDQPRSAFQQEALHGLWLDEEPPQPLWIEMQTRLIRYNGQTLLTFTPVDGTVWMHSLILGAENAKRVGVHKASMYQNRFLNPEAIERYAANFREDPIQFSIRVLGNYELMAGVDIFDPDALKRAWDRTSDPLKRILFDEEGKPIPAGDNQQSVFIWKEPVPRTPYVIGADVGLGRVHGDWSVAYVFAPDSNEFVARWRLKIDPYDFGVQLAQLGRYYNDALIGPEANSFGHSTVTALQHEEYPNLYRRPPSLLKPRPIGTEIGWQTLARTKATMIGEFQSAFHSGMLSIPDSLLLYEMGKAIWLKQDRPGCFGAAAKEGHDDAWIAAMIALQVARQVVGDPRDRKGRYDDDFVHKLEEAAAKEPDEDEETWD